VSKKTSASSVRSIRDFIRLVGDTHNAVRFESRVLAMGRESLDPIAFPVLDGGRPTPAYWGWLAGLWSDGAR
jgi:hypothetical protein